MASRIRIHLETSEGVELRDHALGQTGPPKQRRRVVVFFQLLGGERFVMTGLARSGGQVGKQQERSEKARL